MSRQFVAADFLEPASAGTVDGFSSTAFGPLEEMAFWFGMRDAPESVRTTRMAALLDRLFGILPSKCIPNERLEAIRRLTVCVRHGFARQALIELKRARRTGVSPEQILDLVGRVRLHAPG
jgi:hypothetical protein